MYLIDTSLWVAYLRGDSRAIPLRNLISAGAPVASTEPVLMEVEAGAQTQKAREQDRRLLTGCKWLPFDPISDFRGAADIYAIARTRGITPSGHVDCMIIAVALRNNATLLTLDDQQRRVAELVGVTSIL